MDFLRLLLNTFILRPYVFVFLATFLFCAQRLLGWRRTGLFFAFTWATAFICEFSSTRTGIPFGRYYYTGTTIGQELYLSNVPFFDSLSFTFLLYASYCLSLFFLLPARETAGTSGRSALRRLNCPELIFDLDVRTSWPVLKLTTLFFTFIDVVIDPVALRGDRWFLGQIYGYPDPGVYYGVPLANFLGWAVVGLIALSGYFLLDRRLSPPSKHAKESDTVMTVYVLLGCGLYYSVLTFNLAVTFWIGEPQLGMTGMLIFLPLTALFILRLLSRLPAAGSPARPESSL
jgi:putative membrane protein